jgi:hypothetical protein
MITYPELARQPQLFPALTGLTGEEFERLVPEFEAAWRRVRDASTHTKRGRRPRRRAPGAGHPHALDGRGRLLVALFWLRVYPTYELLGGLFGLDKAAAWHAVQDALAALGSLAEFPLERPAADRPRLGTDAAVFDAFPEVRAVVDAREQPFRRPQGWADQKPFYSGKRKDHTVKTQVVCTPEGRLAAVSASVPGSVHDLEVLRRSGALEALGSGEALMGDRGYRGLDKSRPGSVVPARKPPKAELPAAQRRRNRWISRCRVVVEHVMAQLSRFQALRQLFRGVLGRHTLAVRAVAVLVDRRTAVTPLSVFATAA